MIKITLTGRPLSVNHMYRSAVSKYGKPFTYMTDVGKNSKLVWGITAQHQMRLQGAEIFKDQLLEVDIKFYFENKARRDIDNYLKGLLECLTGVAWLDDSQIWQLHIEKRIALEGEEPRTEILIKEK